MECFQKKGQQEILEEMEIDDFVFKQAATFPRTHDTNNLTDGASKNNMLLERGPSRELFRINSILLRNRAANEEHADDEVVYKTPKKIFKRYRKQKPRD